MGGNGNENEYTSQCDLLMRFQPIYDIAELCVRKNISQAVLCPGSRCAPLTLAFTRHPGMNTRTFSDERSAGFVALGMAQASGNPVVVVCTSGTAVYNLGPAVAEAYFSQTPLIILSADRPAEWIAQHDGQTIYQTELFGKHVKRFYQLPQEYEHADNLWAINRMVNEAVNLSLQYPPGPVHINAPFREPLYPSGKGEKIEFSSEVRIIKEHPGLPGLPQALEERIRNSWRTFHNILLVAGQQPFDQNTTGAVHAFQKKHRVPVVNDVISNLHEAEDTVNHSDLFLGQVPDNLKEMLRPDLLITFGQSLVSKNLKLFLRKYPATEHWHIQPAGEVADTFRHLTDVVRSSPRCFLEFLTALQTPDAFEGRKQENYYKLWEVEERRAVRVLDQFLKEDGASELKTVKALLEHLPEDTNVHLANSMSVRYANLIGFQAKEKKGIRFYSNRGTSGIDGATSTTVGHTLLSGKLNFLITGDLAFFYDRNAFWHNYPLPNLRILLLNNHGGLIFDVLDGPSSTPEAGEYFITRQKLNAKKLCEEFGFDHLVIDDPGKLTTLLADFVRPGSVTKVLELEGGTGENKKKLEILKTKIKKSYES